MSSANNELNFTPSSRDAESKEEEDYDYATQVSGMPARDVRAHIPDSLLGQPPREQVVQVLRSLHHEQLVDLLAPYIQEDSLAYGKLLKESEIDIHRRKLFVHGLPARTTEDQFRSFFEQYGEVELVELPHAKAHSEVKFGFVVFTTVRALQSALEQPNKQFEGKEICCKIFTVRNASAPGEGSSPVSTNHQMMGPVPNGGAPNRKLFVSGLTPSIGDRELFDHFRVCGDIEAAQVSPGKSTGFVLFSEASSARDAVTRLNKSFLTGRQIAVAWYRKPEDGGMRFERKYNGNNNPTLIRTGSQQQFSSPNMTPAYSQAQGWYNYPHFVQQDPYLLVPMPVFSQDFQVDSFFGAMEDQDVKQF